MARKIAPRTKQAIYEISKRFGKRGCTSLDIVQALHVDKKHSETLKAEAMEIMDIGLKVLAGRVTTRTISDESELSLFGDAPVPKEFTDLAFPKGTQSDSRFRTLSINLGQWDARVRPQTPLHQRQSQDQLLEHHFARMRAEGMSPEMSLEEFLKRKK